MGSSLPKFGRIEMEVDGSNGAVTAPPPAPMPKRTPTFGELDLESILGPEYERPRPFTPKATPSRNNLPAVRSPASERAPASQRTPGPQPPQTPTRHNLEAVSKLAAEETRIAQAGALEKAVALSRRPPAPPPPVDGDSSTRIGSFDQIVAGLLIEEPPSSRTAPSASGVASRDDRVAAMRELYAQGDADAALQLASAFDLDDAADSFDGELELEPLDDPFGGLIPVEDDDEPLAGLLVMPSDDDDNEHTAIVEPSADSSRLRAMTSRQIPRLLVGAKEISRLPMDPRAAFILGHIDGIQSMEEILDVCAMPESEALELLERLRVLQVITLD